MRYRDIELTLTYSYLDLPWEKQNDAQDRASDFIYFCNNVESVKAYSEMRGVDFSYAFHRWYNFVCSKSCEEMFCDNGAYPQKNEKDKLVDIWVNGTPFDIKLTILPSGYGATAPKTRTDKNSLIKWLLDNQSEEGRQHWANKIYVVICKPTKRQSLIGKSKYKEIEPKIKAFIEYYKNRPFNSFTYKGRTFFADVICVE